MPAGMKVGIPYDSTEYIQDAINEVLTTLTETLLIVIVVIFLFLGSVRAVIIPVVAIPISLVGAVFLMLVAGFTINLLTLLAIVLSVGLVVDDAIVMVENIERHLHAGKPAAPGGHRGGARAGRPDHRHDDHAGRGVCAGRHPGRSDGRAVPRIRVHPRGGRDRVRRGRADALADDGREAAARGRHRARLRRLDQSPLRWRAQRATHEMLAGTLRYRPVVLVLWAIVAALTVPFYMFSQRELAPAEDQGVVFSDRPGVRELHDRSDEAVHGSRSTMSIESLPETDSIFQLTFPTGGFGGMVTKPWSERTKTTQQLADGVDGAAVADPGHPRDSADAAAAARRRRFPGRSRDRVGGGAAAARRARRPARAESVRERSVHLCRRRPEVRPAAGRGRLRSRQASLAGRRPESGRSDLSTLLGGDYVNRFSIQGRSYKVIPQVKRAERLTPDQLDADVHHGIGRQARPAVDVRQLCGRRTEPRELKKFQQLNAVRIQGVIPPPVPLDQALRFLEDEARAILPQGFTIDYAGESRQLRTEGSKFLGDVPALGDPDLPGPGGPVRELPRSVHHPRGLGAAGRFPGRCCSPSWG